MTGNVTRMESQLQPAPLLDRIRQGNGDAERALVSRFWRGTFFILYRLCDDRDAAADITQEALALVLVKARQGQIDHEEALPAYIRQVAINLHRNSRRKKDNAASSLDDPNQPPPVSAQPSLLTALHHERLMKLVHEVIQELKQPRDRQLLRHFYLYEQSKAAICEQLQISSAHFDRVVFRARERLRALIERRLDKGHRSGKGDLLLLTLVLVCAQLPLQVGALGLWLCLSHRCRTVTRGVV